MRKLNVFNFITLNGYFEGPNGDISWHKSGQEENEYAAEGAQSESVILLGRITYEHMVSYWPTPLAKQNSPEIAEGMNNSEKIVFSKTLKKSDWKNTRIISDNIGEEIKKIKQTPGKDMIILGSGSIVTQFSDLGLIDEYLFMMDPVAIGNGTPLFKNMKHKLDLKLKSSRPFKSGVILLTYELAKS